MRTGFNQDHALLSVSSVFGANVLLLEEFSGTESLSQTFEFHLSMKSSQIALDPNTIIGTVATVTVKHSNGMTRNFSGVIRRFTQAGMDADFAFYSAEMVPALWLLSLSRDRMIFQNKTVVQIIESILGTHSVSFEKKLKGSYTPREYCVQYDETPLDFIMRLMAQEGIYYYFTFNGTTHTLVLADDPSAFTDCDKSTLILRGRSDSHNFPDSVLRFEASGQLVTQTFTGADYDYPAPSTALMANATGAKGRGTFYDYPHLRQTLDAGKKILGVRVQASQVEASTVQGESVCNSLHAGGAFTLTAHPNSKLNLRYALRRVTHRATPSTYTNHFEAFAASVTFRPQRSVPQPVVPGSHSAVVVGPSGEEIWTDTMGRVKVKFHWDHSDTKNDTSSCWVRVSQTWAGNGWGSLFIPRIGQEVIINYLDGNPDRPIITGCVYNGERATPVELPKMQTQSVLRSRPTKTGNGISKTTVIEDGRMHGNEIRFEDKKGDEELYFHAERDLKIDVEDDLETTLYKGSEEHLIKKGDRTIEVTEGNESHSVGGTRDVSVTGDETHENTGNFSHAVKKNYTLEVTKDMLQTIKGKSTIKVTGDLLIDVTGSITFKSGKTISMTSATATTIKAGTALTSEAGTSFGIKAGTDLKAEALSIAGKASASAEINGGGMLTLKGGMVKIN